ncbi:GGDEF domain-containing protein [Luteimonas sp. RD2P54]|uniref:diguanylate cyclase n=1 Tax=Luteimonas endophytica TaxID=3042023 RepID=A0ABT6J9A6_9GAMM|nr:GGDEF domain-containing protein [Luteimonas endophytica]MDH5823410.1 GGDEF domain-containing protein [Luteimonas endophytica]
MHPELETLLGRCRDLPTPPGVALRVLELAQDPATDLAATAEAICLDPALSARILRIANSPLFASATRRPSATVSQALALLGLNAALSLALGFSLATTMRGGAQAAGARERFWRRSVLSAMASRLLGERAGLERLEELMLAGLLQDIGALALMHALPARYASLDAAPGGVPPLQRERALFGSDHAEVGAWLAARWNLPAYLQRIIGHHESGPYRGDPELACVSGSGLLADLWLRAGGAEELRAIAAELERRTGLSGPETAHMLERMSASAPELASLFEVRLEPHEARGLQRQALELMVVRNLVEVRDAADTRREIEALKARTRDLSEQVRRDPLTGAYNRLQLEEVLQREFEEALRCKRPLSIAFIDLDDFKRINDRHGHLVGDQVLQEFSRCLNGRLRQTDLLARYGGEEFLIVLSNCDAAAARATLERILAEISRTPMALVDGVPLYITFSAGLACQGGSDQFASAEDLLKAADEALYGAKRDGRNQVATPAG